jgi:anaerobic selenocysteine-containing dehydrogenase
MSAEERTHYRACNLCEAMCGLAIRTRGAEILSIRADQDDPLARGHVCPKAVALKDVHADPDRLRRPLRRRGSDWEEIDWPEAFDLVAGRMRDIQQHHGRDALAVYLGNPTVHNYGLLTHGPAFLRLLKTRNRYSATSVDQLPHQLVAFWMYGHQFLLPIPDLDRTRLFLVLGANPMASNGSLMTVPDFPGRLKALRARGGKMIVIDPRRSETARVADEHHFIRPGSDAALLFALLNVIFEEGLARPGRLAGFADGLDAVRAALALFTPERVAVATGIAAATIVRLARELAGAENSAIYGRVGLSTQRFGTLCQWAIQLLNLVTGQLDRPGGTLIAQPAVDLIGAGLVGPGHYGRWRSRVRGLPEFAGELPVAALAEELDTPGAGQVRALLTVAGNPVLSTPHGTRLERALAQLEFMVSIDCYLNETTRHAHVILPPTSALEHDHYDLIFHALAVRNTARYNPALFEKPAAARHDWEILYQLARRLARDRRALARLRLRPDQLVDLALQTGPYGVLRGAPPALALAKVLAQGALARLAPGLAAWPDALIGALRRRSPQANGTAALSLAVLKGHLHGVDLGPLRPSFPEKLWTPNRRIRCAVPELLADVPRAQRELLAAPPPAHELRLIGRRHVRSNNSWMHNCERLVKGKPRHQLLMHPDDLAARGIADGARVRLTSRAGALEVEVQASEEMMRGVVSLPHGYGHHRPGTRLRIAQSQPGASVNDVTDETWLDEPSGNAALNGVAVAVEALEAPRAPAQ